MKFWFQMKEEKLIDLVVFFFLPNQKKKVTLQEKRRHKRHIRKKATIWFLQ